MTALHPSDPAPADELLRTYRETRDPEDLGRLFDTVAPGLFRIARSVVGDAALAEDVLQETFLALIEGVETYDPARPAGPWLTGVLKRQAARVRRAAARRPDPSRVRSATPPVSPLDELGTQEDAERLSRALDDLPEPYRGVALMRWRYGLEPAEIADVRGQAPGTIWSLLSRAKEKLRHAVVVAPALLVGLGATRGLAGVKRAVVRRAAIATPAIVGAGLGASAGVGTAAAVGGVIVGKKTIAAVAAALLIGVLAVDQMDWFGGPAPRPADEVSELADAGRPRRHTAPASEAVAGDAGLPAAVDLATVDRDRDLHGIVVGPNDEPVTGARLAVVHRPWREWLSMVPGAGDIEEPVAEVVSASDGTFSLRLVPGALVDLRVSHADHAPMLVADCQAGERVRIELPEGAALAVEVQETDGSPAVDAQVRVWMQWLDGKPSVDRTLPTDDLGRVTFEGLRTGNVFVEAARPNGVCAPIDHVAIPESGRIERTYTFPASRTITGVVKDAGTGAPIEGARVGEGWVQRRFVTTDASGRYTLPGWSGASYKDLSVYADGYVWQRVREPEGETVDFDLQPGDWATGTVVDGSGSPIAGARLIAQGRVETEDRSRSHFDAHATRSNDEGAFALTGLDPELTHSLVISAVGYGRTVIDVPPPVTRGEVRLGAIALPAGRTIAGVAFDRAGRLRADVRVHLRGANPDRNRLRTPDSPGGSIDPLSIRRTDDLGRFRFPDLAPGTYTVSAESGHETDVVLTANDVLDIALGTENPAAAGKPVSSLTFVVRDVTGAAIEQAPIMLMAPGETRHVVTDARGRALVEELSVTAWRYSVGPPRGSEDYSPVHGGPVNPAAQEIAVTLDRLGLISGRILDPDGRPLPRQSVIARNTSGGDDAYGRGNEDGTFEIRAAYGQTYSLELMGDRQAELDDGTAVFVKTPYRGRIDDVVAPSGSLELRTHLPADTRTLEVRLLGPDEEPLAGVLLSVRGATPEKTDADGRVRFVGLPRETVPVGISSGRGVTLPAGLLPPPMTSADVGDESLTLRCARGVPVNGRVLMPDGEPAAGAMALAMAPDRSWRSLPGVCDDDGRFALVVPPDTELHVGAELFTDDGERYRVIHEPAALGDQDVELTLATLPDDAR